MGTEGSDEWVYKLLDMQMKKIENGIPVVISVPLGLITLTCYSSSQREQCLQSLGMIRHDEEVEWR